MIREWSAEKIKAVVGKYWIIKLCFDCSNIYPVKLNKIMISIRRMSLDGCGATSTEESHVMITHRSPPKSLK